MPKRIFSEKFAMSNREKGRLARQEGLNAELRILEILKEYGIKCRRANNEEDYTKKIDLVIEGLPFQVSLNGKSRQKRKQLEKMGVCLISLNDRNKELILEEIKKILAERKRKSV